MDKIKAALIEINRLVDTKKVIMHIPAMEVDTDVIIHDALQEYSAVRIRIIKMWKESRLPIPAVCEILGCTYGELVTQYGTQDPSQVITPRSLSQEQRD